MPPKQKFDQQAAEDTVRAYLGFLADPGTAVDDALVAELTRRLEVETDPMKRLRLAVEIQEAGSRDGSTLESAFVEIAGDWAAAEGIPVGAFKLVGVSDSVLRKAGLLGRGQPARRRRPATASSRVSVEGMQEWALAQEGPFTIRQITEALGGSLVTAKKALDQLVEAGSVQNLGPSDDHLGPGRAPARYATTSSDAAAPAAKPARSGRRKAKADPAG